MSPAHADILLHPIRLRIVLVLAAERRMTTAALAERLPDVAHATLYRHVATLAEAGIVEVVDERRVRGGVERTYALVASAAQLGPEEVAEATPEELLRGFAVFAGSLVDAFARYVTDPRARPSEDPVSYRQAALWLDEDGRAELVERVRTAVEPLLLNGPAEGREHVLLSTVLIPDLAGTPGDDADETAVEKEGPADR